MDYDNIEVTTGQPRIFLHRRITTCFTRDRLKNLLADTGIAVCCNRTCLDRQNMLMLI